MTEPLVPRKLVWHELSTGNKLANSPFGNFEILAASGTVLIGDFNQRTIPCLKDLTPEENAQQHYNELVAACCEVRRCVWVESVYPEEYHTSCEEDRNALLEKSGPFCPWCGGVIKVEFQWKEPAR